MWPPACGRCGIRSSISTAHDRSRAGGIVKNSLKPQPDSSTQEVLAGLVERVTYHNAENGFCVLRIKAPGHREPGIALGDAPTISPGEWVTAAGQWAKDRNH